jgi:SP family arabinose:H+ symporter-like MFS transporter
LAIVVGILLVFFVNWQIQRLGDDAWNTAHGWRWMMGSLVLPSLLFGLLLLSVPESPRWLMKLGRRTEAERILTRVGGPSAAARELAQIERSLAEEEGHFTELLTSGYFRALCIGVGLAAVCQFSGINAIMYYAPEIFKSVGTSRDSAFLQTVVVGVVNVIFTFVAIGTVDRAGRRFLLLTGSAIQVVALAGVGWMFWLGIGGWPLLAFLLLFIAAFAMAMGPVPWIVISEIFPTKVRGQAMSVAIFVLWTSCFIVSLTFPMMREGIGTGPTWLPTWLREGIGIGPTFWFYGLCSLVGLFFVALFVPETKGRTLEEIEQQWRK